MARASVSAASWSVTDVTPSWPRKLLAVFGDHSDRMRAEGLRGAHDEDVADLSRNTQHPSNHRRASKSRGAWRF